MDDVVFARERWKGGNAKNVYSKRLDRGQHEYETTSPTPTIFWFIFGDKIRQNSRNFVTFQLAP